MSDLHAFEGDASDKAPSKLAYSGSGDDAQKLFDGVGEALKPVGVTAVDYVLCPGDITNRADSGALARAWKSLDALAQQLGATLVASAGNHDYASHKPDGSKVPAGEAPEEIDPKDALLQLDPPFPTGTDAGRQCYFAYSHAIVDSGPLFIVTLNTCTYHGLSHENAPEYEHGRVTPHTIKMLQTALAAYEGDPRPRLLLTHHHPIQLPNVDLRERSQIKDSTLLLSALEADGNWIIVHGHKHRPWIQYSHGGGGAPTIVSAGSFAANLGGGTFGSLLRNQFYLLELWRADQHGLPDLEVGGVVRAWTHDPLADPVWYPAGLNQGFSARSGFGWRVSPSYLAPKMLNWIQGATGTLDQSSLVAWEPRIEYVLPSDLERTFKLVEKQGNLRIKRSSTGDFTGVEFLGGGP
jgi:predicted phosphodiesterase